MAIYHFSAKVISRGSGSSALAAAAYRSASRLHDERLDRHHDFTNKAGVVHSEVLLPDGAPEQFYDRGQLWNAVEAAEVRKDAQLAREVEFALPRELDEAEGIRLARDFAQREFVDRGIIADLNVHWDMGADGEAKPHAHVMLSMREVGEEGFGAKVREWNRTELLTHWREAWAEHVNKRLAELDIDARIDHRSLDAQGIDLEPQNKIGPAASRMAGEGLESERADEHIAIARRNGERILAEPALALDAITHQQATFTTRDLAKFVHRHSDGKEQFDAVMAAVKAAPELVRLGRDGRGNERFTSRAMIETEARLERASDRLALRHHHGLPTEAARQELASAGSRGLVLGDEQRTALTRILEGPDLANVAGYAGTGKSALLGVARDAWERAGYRVQGAALSGIAAENLEGGSGIASRTIASLEHQWSQGRELLSPSDVLVIDEAGMIGTRQMERVISEAKKRGAKVVLIGDVEQLQAIEAGAAFRAISERHGSSEITAVRRQQIDWQREATRRLATGRTGEALAAYEEAGHVHAAATRDEAREQLIERWDRDRREAPSDSRIILTHTNDDVRALNEAARAKVREAGELGEEVRVEASRGARLFASGDKIMFLRNERSLGVKNGSLGTVRRIDALRMEVLLDDGRAVAFDHKDYADIDHGYAATIHKAQGMTVDRVHVLATPGLDRHAAYVALSRHRDSVDVHYGKDDFADRSRLVRTLSRGRAKDMASDYSPATEVSPQSELKRDMFDGLKLRSSKVQQLTLFEQRELSSRQPRRPTLEQAVARFARAASVIAREREQGRRETPEQLGEYHDARLEVDAVRPGGARDLRAAFVRDMQLIDDTAAGNARGAIAAMDWERRYRSDPRFRADHFVKTWRQLGDRHEAFERQGDDRGARKVAGQMAGLAKTLERDPQVELLLRQRSKELGMPPFIERPLSQALPDWIGWGRGRGLGR